MRLINLLVIVLKNNFKWILIYVIGVAINFAIISKYYKINYAYNEEGKSFLKAESIISFGATPAVIFVCWSSNRKWCN